MSSSVSQEQIIIEINEIISKNSRPQPIIIQTKAFKKSIEILSKFDYCNFFTDIHHKYSSQLCEYCNNNFPIIEGKDYSCKSCDKIFCFKHRNLLNHQCHNINPSYQKYLMAKNLVKNRMKLIKNQGH